MTEDYEKNEPRKRDWYPVGVIDTRFRNNFFQENFDELKYSGMTFKEIRFRMEDIEATYGDDCENFKIQIVKNWEDGDEVIKVIIKGVRYENDLEYHERLRKKRESEARQEEDERKLYEKLKLKFEK